MNFNENSVTSAPSLSRSSYFHDQWPQHRRDYRPRICISNSGRSRRGWRKRGETIFHQRRPTKADPIPLNCPAKGVAADARNRLTIVRKFALPVTHSGSGDTRSKSRWKSKATAKVCQINFPLDGKVAREERRTAYARIFMNLPFLFFFFFYIIWQLILESIRTCFTSLHFLWLKISPSWKIYRIDCNYLLKSRKLYLRLPLILRSCRLIDHKFW